MRSLRPTLLAVAVGLVGPAAARADVVYARLVYLRGAGAESCPDEAALRAAVAGRLGQDPFREDARAILRAVVAFGDGALRARVTLEDREGHGLGERALSSRSRDCAELASALELAISIALDPLVLTRRPPAPPEPPPPRPPEPPPVEHGAIVRAGLGAVGVAGAEPSATGGIQAIFALRWARLSLGVEGRVDWAASAAAGSGQVSGAILGAALVPCATRGAFAACGVALVGAFRGAGEGVPQATTDTTPYLALGGRVAGELALTESWALRAHVDVLAPLTRTRLLLGADPVWSTPPVGGVFGLAAIASFP